jgi:hypothetical protein
VKNKPWYIQALFATACFACLALLGIAPFAPTKADKALMDLVAVALFAAAFLVLSIYNRIKFGTVFPGLKRDAGGALENSSSGTANKPEAKRVTTAVGLLAIVLLACTAVELVKDKHLPVSTRIPFDLLILGAVAALIRMAFKYRQEKSG